MLTSAEFLALPIRDFYDPPPPVGTTWRCEVPEKLWDAHGGQHWLIGKHLPPDMLSPMIGKTHTSRVLWKYADVKG